ncbi:MAG: hypothetical protein JWN12_404 [Candidatus Saccharibacteria bacterium]|nr:hypothetical protein [Candidatus Saccharibacteria bacterium]
MEKRLKKRTIIVGSIFAIVLIIAIITAVAINRQANHKTGQTIIQNPGYTTILPTGKSIVQLGGWVRVSPTGSDPVYAYADTVSGVPISVSQQPLPASFKNNSDSKVAELAKSYNATATITIGDTTVYIGTSAKGPQSVIFTKSNLLILIKSEKKIENAAWSTYAASLQ